MERRLIAWPMLLVGAAVLFVSGADAAEPVVTIRNDSSTSVFYARAYYAPEYQPSMEGYTFAVTYPEHWTSVGWFQILPGQQSEVPAESYLLVRKDGQNFFWPGHVREMAAHIHPTDRFEIEYQRRGATFELPDYVSADQLGYCWTEGFKQYPEGQVLRIPNEQQLAELQPRPPQRHTCTLINGTSIQVSFSLRCGTYAERLSLAPGETLEHRCDSVFTPEAVVRFDCDFADGYQEKVVTFGLSGPLDRRVSYTFRISGNGLVLSRSTPPISNTQVQVAVMANGQGFLPIGGGRWEEIDRSRNALFHFREVGSDNNFIYIRDDSRRFTLALPRQNGQIHWQSDGEQHKPWNHIEWRPYGT
jgi:hypothetical protein